MKRILLSMLLGLTVLGAQAQGKKVLVTYFSWSNNTKALAEKIQRQTGADIYLQGQRVASLQASTKGLYIMDGKKYIVK